MTFRAGWNAWTIAGLAIALAGPLVLSSPDAQPIYASAGEYAIYAGQAVLWLLAASLLVCLKFGEQQPFATIGLVPPRWKSAAVGLAVGVGVFVVLAGVALLLSQRGLFDNKAQSEEILAWPLWFRIFTALSAGFIEEVIYRGYTIERLFAIVGDRRLAAFIGLAAFTLAHVPFWGWSSISTPLVGGVFFSLLYLWRRDLIACIVAHAAIDMIGIVIIPAFAAQS